MREIQNIVIGFSSCYSLIMKTQFLMQITQTLHFVNPICNILVSIMKFLILIILCLLLASCDGGLAPPPPIEPGFSGTIYFKSGSWPPADSLVSIMIFASKIYPLDSATAYAGIFSNPPTIFFYPDIGKSTLSSSK